MSTTPRSRGRLLTWVLLAGVFAAWCVHIAGAATGDRRVELMPGALTHGHHQIAHDCAACHAPGGGIDEQKCLDCHQAGLDAARDSHPKAKFTDPRNADRIAGLDAMHCVTCHVEHQPATTGPMGVSLPGDYCMHCHKDIGKDRPSHAGLAFSSCQAAGCHNFHDNRALKTEFIEKHLDDPDLLPGGRTPARDAAARWAEAHPERRPLTVADADAPPGVGATPQHLADWEASAHARAGVDCMDCHRGAADAWVARPPPTACAACHAGELAGWRAGLHGMRFGGPLPPMTPAEAELPMRPESAHLAMDCQSCHGAHRYDTVQAAVESCLVCHADQHSRDYLASPHHRSWEAAVAAGDPAAGVSCATCHLPRVRDDDGVHVVHDQEATLRPVEAVVRAACMDCHGYGFAVAALAQPGLATASFPAAPTSRPLGIEWVRANILRKPGAPSGSSTPGKTP